MGRVEDSINQSDGLCKFNFSHSQLSKGRSLIRLNSKAPRPNNEDFLLPVTQAVHKAIWTCWTPEVILPELAPRFWKLTLQVFTLSPFFYLYTIDTVLQLVSRYKTWLDEVLPQYVSSQSNATASVPRRSLDVDRVSLLAVDGNILY